MFMVFHWPQPGRREELAHSMLEMRELLASTPGCIGVEPPLLTEEGDCLIGISKWESRDAFFASGMTLRAPDEVVEGEIRPRERFFLESVE